MNSFLLSEAAFKLAVILYLAAAAGYLIYLVRHPVWLGRAATLSAGGGALSHAAGLLLRWWRSGITHPPFTNLYESLLFFSLSIVVFYLVLERKYKFRAGGAFILPVALGAMGAAVLNPASSKEIQQLLPALQSYWLHAHVAVAALAYAGFVAAFGTSLMFLIKDGVPRRWLGVGVNLFLAFMLAISDRFNIILHRVFTLNVISPAGEITGRIAALSGPGRLFLIALVYYLIAAVFYYLRRENPHSQGKLLGFPYSTLVTAVGGVFTAVGLVVLARAAANDSSLSLFGNPFKIIILCLVLFVSGAAVILDLALDWVRNLLPPADTLDQMTYTIITIAFPLMTMVIVTGMVWAKYALGQYWQWDPKETASLITWLIYTAYLHTRISLNWNARRLALISLLGFASVVFTYLGVNVLGPGYHAYASF